VPATDMAGPKPTPGVYRTLQLVWGSNGVWHGVRNLRVEKFDTRDHHLLLGPHILGLVLAVDVKSGRSPKETFCNMVNSNMGFLS